MWNFTRRLNCIFALFSASTSFVQTFINEVFVFWKNLNRSLLFFVASIFHTRSHWSKLFLAISNSPILSGTIGSMRLWLSSIEPIKHFKNVSRKICSSHCFLYWPPHFFKWKIIPWHKIPRVFLPCFYLTHMYNGAFCDTFFRGSILPAGKHCEPAGKIEPRKNVSQNPHYTCVFILFK